MNSKKYLKILFYVFFAFLIHIFLYFFLNSYNNFFKNLKHGEKTSYSGELLQEYLYQNNYKNSGEINSTFVNNYSGAESKFLIPDINNENLGIDPNNIEKTSDNPIITNSDTRTKTGSIANTITSTYLSGKNSNIASTNLSSNQKQILNLFSSYNLKEKKLDSKSVIFALTDEYPYKYLEYSTNDNKMNFYIFTEKKYEDIINVFDVISYNLYYSIKKVNNFGDSSFYINMDEDYNDNNVRIVFSYKNEVFGLKIKKDDYNNIKKILLTIK